MSTREDSMDHRLVVVASADARQVVTSFPRGRNREQRLLCGTCGGVLAWDRGPMQLPAPLVRCTSCRSLNDPTRLEVRQDR